MNTTTYTIFDWEKKHTEKPFVLSLLQKEPRLRVYSMLESEPFGMDKFYVPTKQLIYMPIGFPAAEHEVAHMVEQTNLSRCLKPDWGMPLKGFAGPDGSKQISSASFYRALTRECRVRAIQHRMDNSTSPTFPANHIYWGEAFAKRHLPFGRFNTTQDVLDWGQNIFDKTYAAWNLDRIEHEWQIRLDYIRNWMESSQNDVHVSRHLPDSVSQTMVAG